MMRTSSADIWDFYNKGGWIVITTNIGWKEDGHNPMGAGIAKAAAAIAPDLPKWYGSLCQRYKESTAVVPYIPARMILFPTKPLNKTQPWLSWNGDSDLKLIEKSTRQLQELITILRSRELLISEIGLPMPGCNNGHKDPVDVLPILQEYLDDKFIVFTRLN